MTSQGSAHRRFTRAVAQKNVASAEVAAKEMGGLSLLDALDYVLLLVEVRPERFEPAAIRWHGRFEVESVGLTLSEAHLALAVLGDLCNEPESAAVLKRLLRRARPTLIPQPR
jgi:hypothetical protein